MGSMAAQKKIKKLCKSFQLGFYDFTLSFNDLKQLLENPDSSREWYRMLSSISGIYLILNTVSGEQYIGSAYGKDGIWNRWKKYIKNQLVLRVHS